MEQDYYAILGVSKTATLSEIKKAYNMKVIKIHLYRNLQIKEEAKEMGQMLNRIYNVLTDAGLRERYDRYGEDAVKLGPGGVPEYILKQRQQKIDERGESNVLSSIKQKIEDKYDGWSVYNFIERELTAEESEIFNRNACEMFPGWFGQCSLYLEYLIRPKTIEYYRDGKGNEQNCNQM
jgi:DnaJ-class molecular chaperone